jgi:alpha-glucosidase (family GH31 glycosyl hydrolase)
MTKPMEFIGRKSISEIILDIYPGKKTTGHLYEDDGESFDYERGAHSLTHFSWANGKLKVDRQKTGYKSAARKYRVLVNTP